ncbi:hypothetical protein BDV95DRAFT_581018 [Massariosphaeria phaeospora]|uniref:Uncharacterized protein n=1 Tax=Massariosphaeria phaeospora TaxID=100035 RepID=A0A7C8M5F8_9PLEO|nr:hypothetical protein BDV95DRAFT_581018 [Massariosphaeria phaeospora]
MCHWVLRVWQCGVSFFTKYSSCSYDRAAHDPTNLLNPLHPSIAPFRAEPVLQASWVVAQPTASKSNTNTDRRGRRKPNKPKCSSKIARKDGDKANATAVSRCVLPKIEIPGQMEPGVGYPHDAKTGKTTPIPLSDIGKASRFGDQALGENCNVFEVVLKAQVPTMCPACARSPRRAKLPAHARGCFGLS